MNTQLIEDHLIAKLGPRPVRELTDSELQRFMNGYVEQGSSRSFLAKLGLFLRAILNRAVDREIIQHNPARKLRAKSRKRASNLAHTLEECDLLLAQVTGPDHLAIGLLIQLGLRSEELFALRRNDVQGSELVIDEAIVDGETKDTKTLASAARMYLPPSLEQELQHYLATLPDGPEGWLFPSARKSVPTRPNNFLNRVLKPAAVKAGLQLRALGGGKVTSAVNFQSLRRTSSTLFGARAKDPKSTQAHMRHTDPTITLRHYQQSVPEEVKAAAWCSNGTCLSRSGEEKGEVTGLKEEDINFEARTIDIHRQLHWLKLPGEKQGKWIERQCKRGSQRTLPITETLFRFLVRHLAQRKADELAARGQ